MKIKVKYNFTILNNLNDFLYHFFISGTWGPVYRYCKFMNFDFYQVMNDLYDWVERYGPPEYLYYC